MSSKPTIIYTLTDEAPLLATCAFLPIVRTFTDPAGIVVVSHPGGAVPQAVLEYRRQQVVLVPDVSVDETEVHPRGLGHQAQGRPWPAGREDPAGGAENGAAYCVSSDGAIRFGEIHGRHCRRSSTVTVEHAVDRCLRLARRPLDQAHRPRKEPPCRSRSAITTSSSAPSGCG